MLDQKNKPFGKLFAHTWTGSMAWQPPVVYAVWSYAIANAKPPHGHVEINVQTISRAFIKDSVENIQAAVDYLCSPDPDSRNKTEDGRRMIHLGAFDYEIVNWAYYRNARFLDEKHVNDAERQRKSRNKLKNQGSDSVTPNVTRHIERHSPSQCVAPTEAEAECVQPVKETGNPPPIGGGTGEPGVDGDTSPPPPPPGEPASGEAGVCGDSPGLFPELEPGPEPGPKTKRFKSPTLEESIEFAREIDYPDEEALSWWHHFESNGWLVGGKSKMKNWHSAMKNGLMRYRKNTQAKTAAAERKIGPNI